MRSRFLVAGVCLWAGLAAAGTARAEDALGRDEQRRLAAGATVVREQTLERAGHRYIGGLTYTVVDAGAPELATVLDDVDAYKKVLPRTRRARLVGTAGGDKLVELTQGSSIMEAEYTIRVRKVDGGREIRFWLDPDRPHGIDDAWGFFRLEPFVVPTGEPRVLLTYGILVDVGPGILRDLFEDPLRAAVLSVPSLVQRYVADRRRSP